MWFDGGRAHQGRANEDVLTMVGTYEETKSLQHLSRDESLSGKTQDDTRTSCASYMVRAETRGQ